MFWSSTGRWGCFIRCFNPTVKHGTLQVPVSPLHSSRFFSSSVPLKCPTHERVNRPMKKWALKVSPFSSIRAQVGCSIAVRPLDPHIFPEADRAFITVHKSDSDEAVGLDQLHVHYDDQIEELLISDETATSSLSVDVTAPIKSNLFISVQGEGNVQVKNMECDICKVQTEMGNCYLHSVKSHMVEVKSKGGNVTGAGTIHGNVDISTCGHGAVDVKKLQGTKMNLSTEHGPLKVKAIYTESSFISSCSGRVELGHVHGDTSVETVSGDTVIDGSNSFLKISSQSGGIDVYVGDGGSAQIHTQEGAVCVRLPSSLKCGVELCGVSVDISQEVVLHGVENNMLEGKITVTGYLHGESPVDQWVRAQADRGSISLRTQSWFESLKLRS